MRARRATVYRDSAGGWRYKVQAFNWRIIDAPEESFVDKSTALARVRDRWPGAELVIEPEGG